MNSLNADIKTGQKVVMKGNNSEAQRTVTVIDGYGMHSFTSGTALFAKTINGSEIRLDAMEIERIVE